MALLAAMLLWSSSFLAMREALQGFSPLVMTALRMGVGACCFVLLLPWLRKGFQYHKGDWKWLLGMAFCEPCLYFIFESHAMVYTTASQAGMVVSVLPLLVSVCAWFIFREALTPRTICGFFIAIGGVVWLSLGAAATESAPNPMLGNLLEIMAMLCATGYTLSVRRLSANYSPLLITAVQSWVGAAFFAFAFLLPGVDLPQSFEFRPTAAVIYLGAFITLGAYGCYNYGISRLGAGKASVYSNLIPVFTLFMGVYLQGDILTRQQYYACAVVLAGVLMSQGLSPRKLLAGMARRKA